MFSTQKCLLLVLLYLSASHSVSNPLDILNINFNIAQDDPPIPSGTCYADDPNTYRKFGARTSYFIHVNNNTDDPTPAGCKPVMMWLNARHGTRGPHPSEIGEMKIEIEPLRQAILKAYKEGKGHMCEKDVKNLEKWCFIYKAGGDRILWDAGRKEMREEGKRWGKRFPGLLKDINMTKRLTSPEQRTHESMVAFLEGLNKTTEEEISEDDFEDSTEPLMRYNELCDFYEKEVEFNNASEANVQIRKLRESAEWKTMIEEISNKTGVDLNTIGPKGAVWTLDIIYITCRYEISNYPDEVSAWCSIFSKSHLQLFEFSDDLSYYYKDGYGSPNDINRIMTQPRMDHLYQQLSSIVSSKKAPRTSAHLHVVHSRIAHTMVGALGFYRDEKPPVYTDWPPPGSAWPKNLIQDSDWPTLWRTSDILSFAHNLAIVVVECEYDGFKVMAMAQERKISLAHICGTEICRLEEFLNYIEPIAKADFDKACELKGTYKEKLKLGDSVDIAVLLDPT